MLDRLENNPLIFVVLDMDVLNHILIVSNLRFSHFCGTHIYFSKKNSECKFYVEVFPAPPPPYRQVPPPYGQVPLPVTDRDRPTLTDPPPPPLSTLFCFKIVIMSFRFTMELRYMFEENTEWTFKIEILYEYVSSTF